MDILGFFRYAYLEAMLMNSWENKYDGSSYAVEVGIIIYSQSRTSVGESG